MWVRQWEATALPFDRPDYQEVFMDTRESKTREEEKEHVLNQRIPEDFDEAEPQRQPEAKKPARGIHKMLPLVIIVLGVIVVGFVILGAGNSGG